MNLEELSKSQLILLTILVNFVTSVATGILTVSLLDQAPPIVAKTVNEVVDHTIETVAAAAPVIAATPSAPAPSTQDLVTGAIAAAAARTVAIYAASTGTSTPAVAVGTYLPGSRAVATAALDALPQEALIEFADGSYTPASLAHSGGGIAIYGFGDKAALPAGASPTLLPAKSLKLGETVLALTPDGSAETGIVSQVEKGSVRTTLADTSSGPAAVDLSGNIIGILAGGASGTLISADEIFALLSASSTAATSTPAHS